MKEPQPLACELRRFYEIERRAILDAQTDDELERHVRALLGRLYRSALALAGDEARFARQFPEQAASLRTARRWSENPSLHYGRLLPFLKTFGRWVICETERRFGGEAFATPRWRRQGS